MKKPLFQNVCIVGVGLIGGSLGMAIKKAKLARWVIGVSRRDSTLKEAIRRKAIDVGTLDLKEGVGGADLVILAGPVSTIISQLKQLNGKLAPGAVVIDVGSTKSEIEKAAASLKKNEFIGCHPMAGSEQSGIQAACAELFKDSICFVVRRDSRIESLWKAVGSKPIVMNAANHDRLVAQNSHTPHALAFSFFQTKKTYPVSTPNPSVREISRQAKSDPEVWADIFLSNKRFLLNSITEVEKQGLQRLKIVLRSGDRSKLVKFIKQANQYAF